MVVSEVSLIEKAIPKVMAIYTLKAVQRIPVSLEQAWDFFSNPANLHIITPDDMGFKVISKYQEEKMYSGQIIEYKVKPLFNISLYWQTEILEVKDKEFFVDIQRKGPYKMWRHEHYFKEIEGGVEMTDIIRYQNPFGVLGMIANRLFIKRKLAGIFEYRRKKVEELFGAWN